MTDESTIAQGPEPEQGPAKPAEPQDQPYSIPPVQHWTMPDQSGAGQVEPTRPLPVAQPGPAVPAAPPAPPTIPGQVQGQNPYAAPGYGQVPPGQPEPTQWSTSAQPSLQNPAAPPYWPPQGGAPGQPLAGQQQAGAPVGPGASGTYVYPVPGQVPLPGTAPDAPPKPKRKTPLWLKIGAPVLALVVIASVLVALHIMNEVNPAVNKVTCDPRTLSTCLIAPPAKAGGDTSSWGAATTVTGDAYAAKYTSAAEQAEPEISSLMTKDGLKGIVHRSWNQGSNQIDLILLSFATAQGAQAWAADRTGEFQADSSGPQVTVPGDSTAKAYSTASPDTSGNINVRYVTTVGDIDFEAHYASAGTLQQQDFDTWAGTEYASLQTAPSPGPAPSPTPTTFQAATCPGALTSCLMPVPGGGIPIPGLATTYTISSYTSNYITKADQATTTTEMQNDNVTGIDSESWGLDGYSKDGQVIVIQTRTDAESQDLETAIGGGDADFTSTFSIPGYAQANASYAAAADSGGLYNGLVTAQMGTIFVSIWVNFTNSFDTATAQSWAKQELDLLTQDTQSHWGFPIPQVTAPVLPAFVPGTCPTTALSDCVMAVPSGSTATTTGGATVNSSLGVSGLVGALYTDRQNYEQAWLNSDGGKDAVSESWSAGNGAKATDYVVLFASSRQAQAAAAQLSGDSTVGTQSCAVSSIPHVTCEVLPEDDSTGAIPIRVTAWSGPYMVDLELTQTDSADTTDALTWAQAQLELLAGS